MTTHKVFNDPIHGTVELHPLLVKIIDTPQFQRLRYIKQLGGVYFVYPGASHNRFEHSIGVAHLAGELVKALKTSQPELNINNRDVLCVQIAGLCHDLGHGPFSHMFETFIHKADPEKKKKWKHEESTLKMFDYMVKKCKLQEEEYEDEDEEDEEEEEGQEGEEEEEEEEEEEGEEEEEKEEEEKKKTTLRPIDLKFIKEMIEGRSPEDPPPEGRPDKPFLYEIVANKRNGIDVDKFDYLARDAHHLGIKTNFDHHRFIKFARVCDVDGQQQICTRDKEVNNLYELYHLRYNLHKKAYQHSVNNIIESMITEAFVKADKHIQIEGKTLSETIDDMEAYTKLTDHVYDEILNSSNQDLAEAKKILEKIVDREHPRCLAEGKLTLDMITGEEMKLAFCHNCALKVEDAMITKLEKMKSEDKEEFQRRWKQELAVCQDDGLTPEDSEVDEIKRRWEKDLADWKENGHKAEDFKFDEFEHCWEVDLAVWLKAGKKAEDFKVHDCKLTAKNFEVHIVELNYGKKNKNPIDEMRFYNKRNPDKAFKLPDDQKSVFHPTIFSEKLIRVYYKKTDEKSEKSETSEESVKKAFRHMELWWKNQGSNPQDAEEDRSPGGNIQNNE